MFSLQRLLGKEDKFFTLLEASAEEARTSVQTLVKLSKSLDQGLDKEEFAYARCKDAARRKRTATTTADVDEVQEDNRTRANDVGR